MLLVTRFMVARNWKQLKCQSAGGWGGMDEQTWYAHTVKYNSVIKRRELLIHRTWMTLEGIMLSESTQVQKVIYYVVAFT